MFDLTDKITYVTGAASGIGRAITQCFADAGAIVYAADVNETEGRAFVGSLNQAGKTAHFVPLDVTDRERCEAVARDVLEKEKRLDVLVNNAGVGGVGKLLETTAEELLRQWQVNLLGPFHLTRTFLPAMLQRGAGSIINMASIGGVVAVRDRATYCITKFAVVGLTKSVALDYADRGVRVNCICPGRVYTEFVKERLAEYPDPEKAYQEMSATQAVGRMGEPEEIAAAALYLAADESRFVTGATFMIDGGWSAGK